MSVNLVAALLGLTSLAVAILLVPLIWSRRAGASREDYNLAVYRDQLAELDRDIVRGVLTTEQAEAARAEIGRRILALGPGKTAAPVLGAPGAAALVAILLVPVAAWLLYAQLGSPSLPDQPFADRGTAPAQTAGTAGAPHADIEGALTKLTAHLKEKPDDLTGWVLLARTEISRGNYQQAADAYGKAFALSGKRADIAGDWGEAQVMAAGGKVTAPAKEALELALKDPESVPRSRYYLAMAQMQSGDVKGAVEAWRKLEAESPADAEWLPLLKQRIAQADAVLNGTAPPVPPQAAVTAPPQTPGTAAAPVAMPDPAAVAAAAKATAGASPEQRQSMIRGMVDSLAARLEKQPDDVEGWARLGRSYGVLNEPAKSRDAYAHAVKLKPDALPLKQAYAAAIVDAAGQDATSPPAGAVALYREILAAEPKNQEALWYVGIAEADAGRADKARELWSQLLAQLPEKSPERSAVEQRIAGLSAPK